MSLASPVNHANAFAAIADAFALGAFQEATPWGHGHINDTFAVTTATTAGTRRVILQRVNDRVFRNVPALMENVQRVTAHVARAMRLAGECDERRALTLIPGQAGSSYHRDPAGNYWRCYRLIENARSYDIVENAAMARETARAIGEFQRLLADLPGPRLHETIPDFHHTRRRFEALRAVWARDPHGRKAAARDEIAFVFEREAMVDVLLGLHASGAIPERITHNDSKLNNVMIDDATQRRLCVIDLDTVMPGLALYDFGDMVRSATTSAAEDETDLRRVTARLDIFEALVGGYLSATRGFLNRAEIAHLAFAGRLITLEIGVRFLTDFLEGDVYFKTARPGHNLDRARNQFAVLRSLEVQRSAMEEIVAAHAAG